MTYQGYEEIHERRAGFMAEHRATYLASGGREGHIVELTAVGARGYLPTLLLKTIGRRTGRVSIVPLLYGVHSGEWIIAGSRGGAPFHPGWFHNLQPGQDVEFQAATQAFRAAWRLAEGEERARVWRYMADLFPPYAEYQKATDRLIPLVMLRPIEEIPVFKPQDS